VKTLTSSLGPWNICSSETFTDILEEILSKEIIDETDLYEDNISKRIASRRPTDSIMKGYASTVILPSRTD